MPTRRSVDSDRSAPFRATPDLRSACRSVWVLMAALLCPPTPAQVQTLAAPAPASSRAVGPAASQPAQAWVRILSVEPPLDQALLPGQRVGIRVRVAYRQPGSGATLALSLQESMPGGRPLAAVVQAVEAAEGQALLQLELRVPRVQELTVYVPLYLHPDESTRQVDVRRWRVAELP